MQRTWRDMTRPIIQKVLLANEGKTEKEIHAALREAWPWGMREHLAGRDQNSDEEKILWPPTHQTRSPSNKSFLISLASQVVVLDNVFNGLNFHSGLFFRQKKHSFSTMDSPVVLTRISLELAARFQPLVDEWLLMSFKIKQLQRKEIDADAQAQLVTLRNIRDEDRRRILEVLEEINATMLTELIG